MKEAEFDLLFKQSSPGLSVTDLDTGISEDEFNSLFQGTQIDLPEEEVVAEEVVAEDQQLGPAVPKQYPTAIRPVVQRPIADPGDVATGSYPFAPPSLDPTVDTIVEDQAVIPKPKLNITPSNRHLFSFLPDDVIQENLKPAPEGYIPAVKSGTWSGLSGMFGYVADFHEAVANSPLFKDLNSEMRDVYRAAHSPELFLLYMALGVKTPARTPEDKIAIAEMDKRFIEQLRRKAEHFKNKVIDLGYKGMTTEDINWKDPSTVWDYTKHVLGSTTFPMLFAIGTMGVGSPLFMAGTLNDELREIEGLDPNERLALATAGGSVQGALELIGLGVITRGVPKSLLGKIGAEKIGDFLSKNFGTKVATRFLEAGAVETTTEVSQQAVSVLARLKGKEQLSAEEIQKEFFEAGAAGLTAGLTLGLGAGTISETKSSLQKRAAEKKVGDLISEMAHQEALESFRVAPRLIPEPIKRPPIVSEFTPTVEVSPTDVQGTPLPATPVEGTPPEGEGTPPGFYEFRQGSTSEGEPIGPPIEAPPEIGVRKPTHMRQVEAPGIEPKKPELVAPELRAETVSTPQVSAISPTEVQESTVETPAFDEHGYSYIGETDEEGTPHGEGVMEFDPERESPMTRDVDPKVLLVKYEGEFRYGSLYNGKAYNAAGELRRTVVNGNEVKVKPEPVVTEPEPSDVKPETPGEWQDYKNAKGKTLAQTKKIGTISRGTEFHPVVVKKGKDGIFRVAEFWAKRSLETIAASQLFRNDYGGNIENVPSGLKNKFATEAEATEAAKNFIGVKVEPETIAKGTKEEVAKIEEFEQEAEKAFQEGEKKGEIILTPEEKEEAKAEEEEEAKEEVPEVVVKEEVVKERQPIQAKPDAKEGEPGFKRKAIPKTNREVITPDNSMKVNTTLKIVELSELIQAEGDFQNRDRSREQSADLIRERAAKFDPPQVTEPARTTDSGPPIMLPSGVIVSGNGRVLTIKELYDNPEYKEQKEKYLSDLQSKFPLKKGYTPLAGINQPVLVQQLNVNKFGDDVAQEKKIIKFVKASNIQKADTLSAGERAKNDVKGTKKVISLFKGSDITSNANSNFVQAFVNENVPASERGEFFTEGSELSNTGLKRIQAALLTAAFGENKSITKLLESTDNDVKAITNAMLNVSPRYVEVSADMDKGIIPKDMDLTPYLIKALEKISTLRQEGIKPAGDFAQTDFLAEREEIRDMFVRAFYHDDQKKARSSKFITNVLRNFVDKILKQDYTRGLPGLEEAAKTTPAPELLAKAIKETKAEVEGGLFAQDEAPPLTKKRIQDAKKEKGTTVTLDEAPPGVDQGGRGRRGLEPQPTKRTDKAEKVSGSDIIKWQLPDYNASAKEQIFFDLAASDLSMAESLSMQERIGIIKNMEPKKLDKLLRKMVEDKFGLKYVEREAEPRSALRNKAALVDSINNMINAYHNLQGMAAVLGLPLKAIGLDGTLGLRVEGMGGFSRGSAAFHMASRVNDPLGAPYITIKYRFNAFAHEWGHALDYFLLNKLGQEWSRGMTNRLRGKSILDEETKERIEPWQAVESADKIKYAFGDLLNAMFQEEGDTVAKILELEGKISRARTDESVKKLERQLEDLLKGMSKKHLSKSEYFIGAKTQLEKSEYYSRPTEMLARAFESYVSHLIEAQSEGVSSPSNEFLTMPEPAYALNPENAIDNILVQDFIKRYPKEAERLLIFQRFDTLFEVLQDDLLEGVAAKSEKSEMIEWTPQYEQKQNNNPLSKEARLQNERDLRVNQRAFEKTQMQPFKHQDKSRAERWWIKLEDGLIHPWLGTKYGTLLSMMRRYKSKKDKDGNVVTDEEGNVVTTRAYKAIRTIFEKLGIEPGGEISTSNTYPEAVRKEVRRLSYVFKTMVDRHDGFLFNEQEEKDLRLLLTSDPKTITRAQRGEMSPKVLKLAGELRNLLNKMYHYTKKGKVNIDFLSANAYLPRILDVQKVFADQFGFIDQAYKLYSGVIWIDQEGNMDPFSEEQVISVGKIANQKKFKVSTGVTLVTLPELEGIVRMYKYVAAKRKEIEVLEQQEGDPEQIAKIEAQIKEYLEENESEYEEGWEAIRDKWSKHLASDWNLRIHQMAGEDPSASSPMANFTKKRVMPKEADKFMIDYYTDPIDAIGKYITGVVRKTEYNRRFGRHLIPPGKKRFAVTKQLQDYLDYLFREEMAGEVDPVDVQNMRTDIDAILGRTAPTDMGLRKTLNTAHAYALMGMLSRAVFTSIPEPFVAGIKMKSSLKGLQTFGLTLQEALTYVSKDVEQTVQKRRQIANILGLLDDPSVGEMASNRAGGTMMDDPKNQARMNLWFVRVGLQGLTNAQRRATMVVSFQYLKELGSQYLTPVGKSEKAIADNKKEAELVLMDLGIPKEQLEDFSKYMIDMSMHKGLPDPEMLMDQFGDLTSMSELLSISSGRIVERSIQDPLIGNRPRYAEHPLGKFVYSIQSFNYSFQQNVLVGEAKHITKIFKNIGSKRAALVTAQLLGPIFQLYVAHAMVSALRELAMNRERWEEKKKEGKLGSHIAGLTVSRAGTFGAWDPLVNAYTGLRYQRDISNLFIGAIGAWYTKPTEDIIKLFSGGTNSPNTTATEERAIRAFYQLAIVPMMVFAVSNPQFLSLLGPWAGPVAGAIAMTGTSHTVKKAVSSKAIKALYGSKGDMSRRKVLQTKARKARKAREAPKGR